MTFLRDFEKMGGAGIDYLNRMYKHTLQKQHSRTTKTCPYSQYEYDELEDKVKTTSCLPCSMGQGEWCANCGHFMRYKNTFQKHGGSSKAYKSKKKRILKSYSTTGKAPWKRKLPTPEKITNPYRRF